MMMTTTSNPGRRVLGIQYLSVLHSGLSLLPLATTLPIFYLIDASTYIHTSRSTSTYLRSPSTTSLDQNVRPQPRPPVARPRAPDRRPAARPSLVGKHRLEPEGLLAAVAPGDAGERTIEQSQACA